MEQATSDDAVYINMNALYQQHADLRLFVLPGDMVISHGEYARVKDVRLYRVGQKGRSGTIRGDWDAIRIQTERGDRWFGYPPRTLPKVPVSRKRPLW
jgi:hypothetical protein